MQNMFDLYIETYIATYYAAYHIEMATQADRAIENGMRTGNYTLEIYLEEAWQYEEILFGLPYRAPGISPTAPN